MGNWAEENRERQTASISGYRGDLGRAFTAVEAWTVPVTASIQGKGHGFHRL